MKKIFLLSTILLFISCGREKKVEDTESFEWGKVEMSQEMRDSLFLLGKYCIPSYDSTQIYYEYKRDTLEEDSIIEIWYVQPDSNYWFEDIIYNYHE